MKALTVEKAQEIRAGKGHYHWICRAVSYTHLGVRIGLAKLYACIYHNHQ